MTLVLRDFEYGHQRVHVCDSVVRLCLGARSIIYQLVETILWFGSGANGLWTCITVVLVFYSSSGWISRVSSIRDVVLTLRNIHLLVRRSFRVNAIGQNYVVDYIRGNDICHSHVQFVGLKFSRFNYWVGFFLWGLPFHNDNPH